MWDLPHPHEEAPEGCALDQGFFFSHAPCGRGVRAGRVLANKTRSLWTGSPLSRSSARLFFACIVFFIVAWRVCRGTRSGLILHLVTWCIDRFIRDKRPRAFWVSYLVLIYSPGPRWGFFLERSCTRSTAPRSPKLYALNGWPREGPPIMIEAPVLPSAGASPF